MATKEKNEIRLEDQFTIQEPEKKAGYTGPMVEVFIPALEDTGSNGLKVDQYEHVTIANETGEKTYYIHRGERVDVPVPVFMVLKEKYPKL